MFNEPVGPGRERSGEGVAVVAPLVEALLTRALQRRAASLPRAPVNRLVGEPHPVDSVGYVGADSSVLLRRPGGAVEVRPAGSLLLPALRGPGRASYVVVSHAPVRVWLRVGPFETLDGRAVHQVELELTVSLADSAAGLAELADPPHADPRPLDEVGDALLDRLAREVSARTTEAIRRRRLSDLAELSLGVLLDGALPETLLGGLVTRSGLEVTDVDWPTEGRSWANPAAPRPEEATGTAGPVSR